MNRFVSNTKEQREAMLKDLNMTALEGLFDNIPEDARIKQPFVLPEALSEYDLKKVMQNLAGRNISASDAVCFLGAGVYDHFVPSIVNKLGNYAALCIDGRKNITECRGILQAVYELQLFMQNLTGMKTVSVTANGMSEALEKTFEISLDMNKAKKVVVCRGVNPEYKKIVNTYCNAYGIELAEAGAADGATSGAELQNVLDCENAFVIAQSPNYFGIIEDMQELSDTTHKNGALFVAVTDPVSLAVLKTPGEYSADIAIGNGQPLGGTLSHGAHYFAYMGTGDSLKEYIIADCVRMTDDGLFVIGDNKCPSAENRHYSLLHAFSAAVYMSHMGSAGLKAVAKACYSNAYYTYEKLCSSSAFKPVFNKPFFREFVVKATKKNVNDINIRMLDYGMIGGVALKKEYPDLGNAWLVAVTEKRSADEVELFVKEASRSI